MASNALGSNDSRRNSRELWRLRADARFPAVVERIKTEEANPINASIAAQRVRAWLKTHQLEMLGTRNALRHHESREAIRV